MVVIIDFVLEYLFAIPRELYQQCLKRCTTGQKFHIKLPLEVVEITAYQRGIRVTLSDP